VKASQITDRRQIGRLKALEWELYYFNCLSRLVRRRRRRTAEETCNSLEEI
jgi:hypothetical protein